MTDGGAADSSSAIGRLWRNLRMHRLLAAGFCGAVVFGLALAGGGISAVQYTSETGFCISCHVMADTVYPEYQKSAHYKNAYGVVVGCADCHVPHGNWIRELTVKTQESAQDIYAFAFRGINTTAAFTKERPKLARQVLAYFKADNARECRQCHDYNNMVLADQPQAAQLVHPVAMKTNENCVDCHKGVAHELPPGAGD